MIKRRKTLSYRLQQVQAELECLAQTNLAPWPRMQVERALLAVRNAAWAQATLPTHELKNISGYSPVRRRRA